MRLKILMAIKTVWLIVKWSFLLPGLGGTIMFEMLKMTVSAVVIMAIAIVGTVGILKLIQKFFPGMNRLTDWMYDKREN